MTASAPVAAQTPSWLGTAALVTGAFWALRGWVALGDPVYWSPQTAADYAAVALYSAALITLAICVWAVRVIGGSLVLIGGSSAAAGLLAAGIANLVEDGLGLRVFGGVYVAGVLLAVVGLVALATGLFRGHAPFGFGGLVVLTLVGLLFSSLWIGYALLAGSWIAAGLRLTRRA